MRFDNLKKSLSHAFIADVVERYLIMKEIEAVDKIDNSTIKVTYEDGKSECFTVIKLESREKALKLCESYTKIELLKPSAFDRLNDFFPKSCYDLLRNYEIEDYLDTITGKYGHKINELCPFNGFMWFD
jgi:hypothetical protein